MKVVITGGHGFLGWHTACRLRALHEVNAIRLARKDLADPELLASHLQDADVVLHLAGVNRATSDEEVESGNVHLAERLGSAIAASRSAPRVVYANSIQSGRDTPYGRGKAEASRILAMTTAEVGGSFADVLLPNLFGEHGRPRYNSFVATFCHLIASGERPIVSEDKDVPLLHAQKAAAELIAAMDGKHDVVVEPMAVPRRVSDVLAQLSSFHELYRRGEIPSLPDDYSVDLFNTYRSYTFPNQFPRFAVVHADSRGDLFETMRSHGGTGQSFVSTTKSGQTRGDHFHLTKVERFFVVRGTAEITLRRLLDDSIVRFRIDGERPGYVDMPTLWVHNIRNIGADDLVTVFWTDQLLDSEEPDQYPEQVVQEARA